VPHDLLKTVPGEVLRWALLAAHYRQPLDWTGELIEQSRKALDRLYGALQRVKGLDVEVRDPPAAFIEALSDDLNTPKAYAELFGLAKTLETAHGDGKALAKADLLAAANLLGFLKADPDVWFAGGADEELKGKVEALLEARVDARADKNWAEADRIRGEIDALGVIVMDSPQGATWRLKEGA
jgi:cysteinyl-tRNA synthetase